MNEADLRLLPGDPRTWQRAVALRPRPEQARFVASNAYSLAEAAYSPEMVPWLAVAGDDDASGTWLHVRDPLGNRIVLVRLGG